MVDCLIIGGGIVGLSIAYELSRGGAKVRVIDRGAPGAESSWAGAGILPPASLHEDVPAKSRLTALSNQVHDRWHAELLAETGIDNGLRRTGGLYFYPDEAARDDSLSAHRAVDVRAEAIAPGELPALEPALRPPANRFALLLPDEAQIRNPRHVKALLAACARRGVGVSAGIGADRILLEGERIAAVETVCGTIRAAQFVIASGAWSHAVATGLPWQPRVKPVRGQIALVATDAPLLSRVVNEDIRYIVPRGDGRALVGSTEENAGFDKRPTAGAIHDLLAFGRSLVPALAGARLERTWAGLRPGTPDGFPYLGALPGCTNGFIAAGHFRSGLQLSAGTAVVMAQLLGGQRPQVDLAAFHPLRSMPDDGR